MCKECMFLDEWKHCKIAQELISTKEDRYGNPRKHLLIEQDLQCEFFKNCPLKLKEKEIKKLENEKQTLIGNLANYVFDDMEELEKYKNALKEIKEHCRVYLRPKHKREYDEKMGGYFESNIEEIVNEVLNGDN